MNSKSLALVVPLTATTLLLGACGGNSSSSTATANTGATSTSTSTTTASSASAPATDASQCPTSNTRSFAKTRFVTDVGLAAGTFHRYIYKPYQAGTFTKGAHGRTTAMVKAGAVALVDTKLVDNAYKNVQASPALCKVLVQPLGQLKDSLGSLKSGITSGDVSQIAAIEGLVKKVEGTASANGAPVNENDDLQAAQSAKGQG